MNVSCGLIISAPGDFSSITSKHPLNPLQLHFHYRKLLRQRRKVLAQLHQPVLYQDSVCLSCFSRRFYPRRQKLPPSPFQGRWEHSLLWQLCGQCPWPEHICCLWEAPGVPRTPHSVWRADRICPVFLYAQVCHQQTSGFRPDCDNSTCFVQSPPCASKFLSRPGSQVKTKSGLISSAPTATSAICSCSCSCFKSTICSFSQPHLGAQWRRVVRSSQENALTMENTEIIQIILLR